MAKFANTKGLSKQEKFMIQGMITEDNSVEDIAKYLDREVELVEGFIEDIKPEDKPVETQENPSQNTPKMSHIINRTASGNKGIVAMTPAGSQQADAPMDLQKAKEHPYIHAIQTANRFMVKVGQNGRLFNPYGLYSEGMETKQRVGRPTWKFVTTNESNFKNYVKFLTTKNEVFLKNAEREII